MAETWDEKVARLREEWAAQDAESRRLVDQKRAELGVSRFKPSGDADTGSLSEYEEDELRRRGS